MPTFTNLTSGSSTTSFVTASVTPTANRLVLVAINGYIATGGVDPSTPTVTGNGMSPGYELVDTIGIDQSGATDRSLLWVFRGMSASPSAGAITISFSGTVPTRVSWIVDQSSADVATGGNGANAIIASTLNQAVSAATVTTQPVSFAGAGMTSGNGAYFACGIENNNSQTQEAGWTQLANSIGTSLVGLSTQYLTSGTDTSTATTWTTAARAGAILIEIAAPVTAATKAPQVVSQYAGFF